MWYKPEMAGRVKTFYHTCRCFTDFTGFTAATVLLRLYYCFIRTACSYATALLLRWLGRVKTFFFSKFFFGKKKELLYCCDGWASQNCLSHLQVLYNCFTRFTTVFLVLLPAALDSPSLQLLYYCFTSCFTTTAFTSVTTRAARGVPRATWNSTLYYYCFYYTCFTTTAFTTRAARGVPRATWNSTLNIAR
jgi:hypothetical protein